MKIKENLVYEKHGGRLVGFFNLGEINNQPLQFEQSLNDEEEDHPALAKTMICFMVKGLFSKLRFLYAQFPCTSITGEQIFTIFWQAVFCLERMGFKVLIQWCIHACLIFHYNRYWQQHLMGLQSTGYL